MFTKCLFQISIFNNLYKFYRFLLLTTMKSDESLKTLSVYSIQQSSYFGSFLLIHSHLLIISIIIRLWELHKCSWMFPSKVSLLDGAHFPNGGAMYNRIQVLLGTVIHTPTLCFCVCIESTGPHEYQRQDSSTKFQNIRCSKLTLIRPATFIDYIHYSYC